MSAYYNENDPYAAAWLRNLIAAGHIAPGEVDERSIEDVSPADLASFTQCHFFAGIGVWSHALRLAGYPDDRPVWTGSCPCQPFSAAGKAAGFSDERHLWPAFHHLIRKCRPRVVFGEQVASRDGLEWLDLVSSDLEAEGYAVGAADLCVAGIGAPHIRQRLWFVAQSVADAEHDDRRPDEQGRQPDWRAADGWSGAVVRLADAAICGQQGPSRSSGAQGQRTSECGMQGEPRQPSPTNGLWRDADWLYCRDGKWRPVEPGTFPLAHGSPARVGRLRAYGNAIVPQVAAEVIRAFMEARP